MRDFEEGATQHNMPPRHGAVNRPHWPSLTVLAKLALTKPGNSARSKMESSDEKDVCCRFHGPEPGRYRSGSGCCECRHFPYWQHGPRGCGGHTDAANRLSKRVRAAVKMDFALHAEREQGLSPEQSIRQACLMRFRPILMTTMCPILGGLLLMLGSGTGSELRKPLGFAMVGGLTLS